MSEAARIDFAAAAAPLNEAYEALALVISEREAELAELREQRNRLGRAVRALNPEIPSPNGKAKKKAPEQRVGQASIDYVHRFLLDHSEILGEFGTTALLEHPDYQGVGGSTLPQVLRKLHEGGVLRLVRKGKGMSRYYEVIR